MLEDRFQFSALVRTGSTHWNVGLLGGQTNPTNERQLDLSKRVIKLSSHKIILAESDDRKISNTNKSTSLLPKHIPFTDITVSSP